MRVLQLHWKLHSIRFQMLIVVMGVAGSGKTTISRALASELGWQFVEGDLFHSPDAVQKMKNGFPLDDADRAGWLFRLHEYLLKLFSDKKDAVMSSSALKRRYRDLLRRNIDPHELQFVYLSVTPETARKRMRERVGHFMPEKLIFSQFEILEPPNPSEALWINAEKSVSEIVSEIASNVRSRSQFSQSAS
jgi:gluconokinase